MNGLSMSKVITAVVLVLVAGTAAQERMPAPPPSDPVRVLAQTIKEMKTASRDLSSKRIQARTMKAQMNALASLDQLILAADRLPKSPRPSQPKPGQDQRMDQPTIGPSTVAGVVKAGLNGIVVAAGKTMLMEEAATRQAADQAGVFVFGARPEDLVRADG